LTSHRKLFAGSALLCSAWLVSGCTNRTGSQKCRSAASPSCPRSNNICCRLCMWRQSSAGRTGARPKRSRQPENRCIATGFSIHAPSTRFPTATFSSLSRMRPAPSRSSDPRFHHEVGPSPGATSGGDTGPSNRITLLLATPTEMANTKCRAFSSITSTRLRRGACGQRSLCREYRRHRSLPLQGGRYDNRRARNHAHPAAGWSH